MNYIAFFTFVFLTSITPGPNNLMSMSITRKYGTKNGLRFVFGSFIGFLGLALVCGIFSALLYEYIPSIEPYMLAIGSIYVLYLAWTVWSDKPHNDNKKEKTLSNFILQGAILQFVNVKVIIFELTAWSSYILPNYSTISDLTGWYILLASTGPFCAIAWVILGATIDKLFKQYAKAINAIMALGLCYCALTMILEIF